MKSIRTLVNPPVVLDKCDMQEKSIVYQLKMRALLPCRLFGFGLIKNAMCDPSRKHFNRCTSLDGAMQQKNRVRWSLPNKIQSISAAAYLAEEADAIDKMSTSVDSDTCLWFAECSQCETENISILAGPSWWK